MISNTNASKEPSNVEYVDVHKYVGVASINIVAVNPNNDKLRKYGWNIPEEADEPNYVHTVERDGKIVKSARVRFLAQIQDLDDKPIVPMDFWCRQELCVNRDGSKCKVIDTFGRTAWATKEDVQAHRVPQYSNGPANISYPYRPCHVGEEELVSFLMKYLNVTPFQIFDRKKNGYVNSTNPGRLTIDSWESLCSGDAKEIREMLALQPENKVKVILGIRSTDDNKSYQTFLNSGFLGNSNRIDVATGEYSFAKRIIDKWKEGKDDTMYSFSAFPVKEWKETSTEVSDNAGTMFDDQGNYSLDDDDLPFGN